MVNPRYVAAAIDQGTTSTRCMVFDRQGRMVSIAQREHRRHFPRPGWVEHDAAEIWSIVKRILPQALSRAGIGAEQIVALGVTNQRETTVVWDPRTGQPVAKAIVCRTPGPARCWPGSSGNSTPARRSLRHPSDSR